uniref:Phorbol-ester/DAG-type domain-containing protein n=1 Tax=Oncorhynchus tshawytscha TaxID=74940 RepID=A0AAZ3NTG6_ONCTS
MWLQRWTCNRKEKDKDKSQGKEKDSKEKKTLNGHLFSSVNPAPSTTCHQCNKPINTKEAFLCTNCNAQVHKGCRDSLPVCVQVKMKVTFGSALSVMHLNSHLQCVFTHTHTGTECACPVGARNTSISLHPQ